MTTTQLNELRRTGLLEWARALAPRARRMRATASLVQIRHIGSQLDALDPAAPEATDVLRAAADALRSETITLDDLERVIGA